MSTHTPGPWGILKAGNQWAVAPVTAKGKPRDGRQTEDICMGSVLADNFLANARLIAAAPDLLAAARALVQIYEEGSATVPIDDWWLVRAAIAKAEGK